MFGKNNRISRTPIYKPISSSTNDTSYKNSERYSNLSNNISNSGQVIANIEGDVITNLNISEIKKNSISINYFAVKQPFINYILEIQSEDKIYFNKFEYRNQNYYTISGLRPGVKYNIYLTATTFYNTSSSLTITATTLNPPDIPTQLTATNITNSSVSIQYTHSIQTIIKYTVYTYVGSSTNPIKIIDVSSNIRNITIEDLVFNTTYSISVTASNNFGESDESEKLTVKTRQFPDPPTNIIITPNIENSNNYYFNLTFTPCSQFVDYYTISINPGNVDISFNGNISQYKINNLLPNTSYNIIIIAYNNDGQSTPVEVSNITSPVIYSSLFSEINKNNMKLSISGDFYSVNVYDNQNRLLFNNRFFDTVTIPRLTPNTPYFYYLIPINSNDASGNVFITNTKYTLIDGTILSTSDETSNSIKINWRGSYTSVSINRGSSNIIPGNPMINYPYSTTPQSNIFGYVTDIDLSSNVSYTYTITMYNGDGISTILNGNTIGTTHSLVYNARFSNITNNSITISDLSGNYSSLKVIRTDKNTNSTVFNINSSDISPYFIDTNLLPDSKYIYTLIPYSLINNSFLYEGDSYYALGYTYTLPIINSANILSSTYNTITLNNISGVYSKVFLYRYKNEIIDASYSFLTNISSYIDINGLLPNTPYTYKLIPYNFENTPGNIFEIGTIYTDISGTPLSCISISEFQLKVSWKGYYSSAIVTRTASPTNITLSDTTFSSNFFYSTSPQTSVEGYIIDNNLLSNTEYRYEIILNNGNLVGKTITTSLGNTTLGNITSYSFGNSTGNSISIQNLSGNYNYISVNRTDAFFQTNTLSVPVNINNVTDIGLYSNRLYNYSLTPYNTLGYAGNVYNIGSKYTLAVINNVQFGTITDNSIQIANISGEYYYIYGVRSTIGSQDVSFNINSPDNSYTDNNLLYNTKYSYSITPYNIENISNTTTLIGNKHTKANGISYPTTNITVNTCNINWSGTYTSALIIRNPGNVVVDGNIQNYPLSSSNTTNVIGNTIDVGLLSNTLYTYTIFLYNGDKLSTQLPVVTALTLPSITSASFGNHTDSSITINPIIGNYDYIIITRTGGNTSTMNFTIYSPSNNYTDTGLLSNNNYTYNLTPYNSSNFSGQTYSLGSLYTDITGTILPVTNITTNSVLINWSGKYSTALVTRYPDVINVTNSGNITSNYTNGSTSPTTEVIGNVTDIALIPNTTYTYKISLYNGNYYPTVIGNITANTLPSLISATYDTPTTDMRIAIKNITGYYNKYTFTRTGGIEGDFTSSYYTDNSFTDSTTLSKNTKYTYTITPYNIDNAPGITIPITYGGGEDGTIYTRPEITSVIITNVTSNSIKLQIVSTTYYYSIVKRISDLTNFTIYQSDGSGADIGLLPNTPYNYTITPYNFNDISNSSFTFSNPIYTLGSITNASSIPSANSVTFNNIVGSYKYFIYSRTGGNEGLYTSNIIYGNNFTDPNILTPNVEYIYVIIPYNNSDISGNSFIKNVYTLPSVTASFGLSTINSIQIDISGFFQTVEIDKTNLSGINTTSTITWPTLIYTDTDFIAPDTSYNYTLIPYNNINVQGNIYSIGPLYSLPRLTSSSYGLITDTSISIVNIRGNFKYAIIIRTGGGSSSYSFTVTTPITSGIDNNPLYPLLPDTSYNYIITPYTEINTAGTPINLGTVYTLPIISSAAYSSITSNSVAINLTGYYASISINRTGGPTNSVSNTISYPITTITDSNLIPNTQYIYSLSPYTESGIGGIVYNLSSIYTNAYGTIISVTSNTSNSIRISWSGYYNSISVVRNSNLGAINLSLDTQNYPNSNSPQSNINGYIIDQGLSSGTLYIYTVTMYNAEGSPFLLSNSVSSVTLPTINTASFSGLTISSISLNNVTGSYSYVNATATPLPSGVIVDGSFNTSEYNINNLRENTNYSVTLVPYNNLTSIGNPFFIGSIYTLPTLRTAQYGTISNNSISINSLDGSYNYVNVYRNSENNPVLSITSPNNSAVDSNQLFPNTLYYYTLVPYNGNSIPTPGSNVTLSNIYTYADGVSSVPSNETSTSLLINWSGIYANAIVRGVDRTANLNTVSSNNYTLSISPQSTVYGNITEDGLSPNTLYTYDISLNNSDNIPISLDRQSRYTLASGSSLPFGDISSNALQINWQGIYSNISVLRNDSIVVSNVDGNNYITSSSPQSNVYGNVIDTDLLPNTLYNYKINLINGNNISVPISDFSRYTLSRGTTTNPSVLTSSSIQVYWSGIYSNINVYRNGMDFSSDIVEFSNLISPTPEVDVNGYLIDSGLEPNTSYYYDISMNNGNNISTDLLRSSVNTLCSITDASININVNNITLSNITAINGYSKVEIYDSSTNGTLLDILNDTSSIYTAYNGSPPSNTLFSYYLLPYNGSNYPGSDTPNTYFNKKVSTYATITSATIVNNDSQGIFIGNVFGNNGYNKVEIYRQDTGSYLYATLYNSSDSYTDYSIGEPGTLYYYLLLIYNIEDKPGNNTENTYYSYSIAQVARVDNASVRNITATSTILDISGIFSNVFVTVSPNINVTPLSGNTLIGTNSISESYSGFLPNQTYEVNVYPINLVGYPSSPSGPNYSTVNFTTLSTGESNDITNITSTSITLNWYGTYSTASVIQNNDIVVSTLYGNNYSNSEDINGNVIGNAVDESLTPNTLYYYDTMLYNRVNNPISLERKTAYTLSSLSSAIFDNITSTSIDISNIIANGNGYANIELINNTNSASYYGGSSTMIRDNIDLLPNTQYNYSLLPYNGNNVAGSDTLNNLFEMGNTCTLSDLKSVNILKTMENISISDIVGNYTSVSVYSNSVVGNILMGSITSSGDTLVDINANISSNPNTLFNYYILPYNQLGVMGNTTLNSIIQSDKYSYAYANINPISDLSSNAIGINWTGAYSDVIISRSGGGGGTLNVQNGTSAYYPNGSGSNIVNGNIIDTGLNVNTLYTYDISVNNPDGDVYYAGNVATYTLATGNSLASSDISATEIQVNWNGIYSNVSVSKNGTTVSNVNSNNYTSSLTPQSFVYGNVIDTGLTPNNLYTYDIILYNANGIPYGLESQSQYTLAYGNSSVCSDLSSSAIQLNWDGYYNSIDISRNNTVAISVTNASNYYASSLPSTNVIGVAYDTGLEPNTNYYYSFSMKNGNNISTSLLPRTRYTLASISNAGFGTVTSSNIIVSDITAVNGFSKVDIYRNTVYMGNITSGTSYTDNSGLVPNSQYSYSIIPYNGGNIEGHNVVGGSYNVGNTYTLSKITGYNIDSRSGNVVISDVSGLYANVNLYSSDGSTVLNSFLSSSDIFTDTSANSISNPNTQFTYNLLPYNNENVAGNVTLDSNLTISTYTLSSITGYNFNAGSGNVVISGVEGFYGNVTVFKNGNNTPVTTLLNSENNYTDTTANSIYSPNTLFTYNLLPYNNENVAGNITSGANLTISGYTLATVNGYSINANNGNIVISDVSGGYANVNLYKSGNSTILNTFSGNTDIFTDISANSISSPNTEFTYNLLPYNAGGVSGNVTLGSNLTISTYTLSSVTGYNFTINSANIVISDVIGSYANVQVFKNGSTTPVATLLNSGNSYTDTNIGGGSTTPNSIYGYTLVPYNNIGISGNITLNSNISIGSYSLSVISSATLSSVSSGSISITNIVASGGYSNIQINNVTSGNTYYAGTSNNFTDLSGLVPNTLYTYTLMPYNNDGIGGNGVTGSTFPAGSTYTLASISSVDIINSNNTITISNVTGVNGYSKVEIYDLISNGTLLSTLYDSTGSYSINSILPNSLYSYYLLPYNGPNNNTYLQNIIDTNGLSLYYRFNTEDIIGNTIANYASGSAIYDASGSSSLIVSSDKKYGSGSLLLNGTSQYVSLPSVTSGTNGISFSCWIKQPDSNTNTIDPIIYLYDTASSFIGLSINNSANVSVRSGNLTTTSPSVLTKNSWQHVSATLDTSGKTSIYVNGSLVANSITGYETINTGTKTNCYIGYYISPYNDVLTYSFRMKLITPTISPTDLTGNYQITNTGTVQVLNNNTRGNVYSFNGSNSLISSTSPVRTICTLCFWVYYTESTSQDNSTLILNTWWPIYYKDNKLSTTVYYTGDGPEIQETSIKPKNTWVHYAISIDLSNVRMYVNGVIDKTVSLGSGIGTGRWERINQTVYTSSKFGIGTYTMENGSILSVGTARKNFTGLLDDVRVYGNIALSAENISNIYNYNSNTYFNGYFNGYIDDLRLYKRVLTNNEIVTLSNSSSYNGSSGHNITNARYYVENYTLATVTGYSISATSGNVVISGISGSYANVNLYKSGESTVLNTFLSSSGTFNDISANSISSPNTIFTYNLLPYNSGNVAGNGTIGSNLTISTYTLSSITGYNFNAGSGNVVISGVEGFYGNVTVFKSGSITPVARILNSGNTYTDTTANSFSSPNTQFTYNLLPYNTGNIAGNIISNANLTISGYTLSKITGYSISAISGNVVISDISGGYANVNLYRSVGDTVLNTFLSSSDNFNDISANSISSPNTLFTYNLLPYNSSGIAGNVLVGSNVVASLYTLSTGTIGIIDDISINKMRLNWSGTYANVIIKRVTGGGTFTSGTPNNYSIGGNQTLVSGNVYDTSLNPNTLYAYDISLNNGNNIPTYIGRVGAYTLANGISSSCTNFTSTSMQINWTGTYSNAYVYKPGETTAITGDISSNYTVSSAPSSSVTGNLINTGLDPNTLYYYDISLNNGNGLSTSLTRQSAYTLANITSAGFGTSTSSNIVINGITATNGYSKVGIYRGTDFLANITTDTYTDISGSPNTTYSYFLLPYNGNNIAGHQTVNNKYSAGPWGTAPGAPTITSIDLNDISSCKVNFSKPSNTTGISYSITYGNGSYSATKSLSGTITSPYILTDLSQGLIYSIYMNSINTYGNSQSNTINSPPIEAQVTRFSVSGNAVVTDATDANYYLITMTTSNSTITLNGINKDISLNILAVGGGGGGSGIGNDTYSKGGGGGGGGNVYSRSVILSNSNGSSEILNIYIGNGGIGQTTIIDNTTSGENTTVSFTTRTTLNITANFGNKGTSSGGTSGNLKSGGTGIENSGSSGGGGGGCATSGTNANTCNGGIGGNGIRSTLPGINQNWYFGAGGGGATITNTSPTIAGNAGLGGGGGGGMGWNGGVTTKTKGSGGINGYKLLSGQDGTIKPEPPFSGTTPGGNGGNAAPNSGSGGGGGGGSTYTGLYGRGGNGSSGICLITIKKTDISYNQ